MRSFRTLVLTSVVLSLGSAVASAQSLAEVAKKEKERRTTNKGDSKRVITDRELTSSFPGLPTSSTTGSSRESTEEAEAGAGEGAAEPQDETKTQDYWQNRVKTSKDKIAKIEQQLQSENWGDGQRVGVDPRGMNNLSGRQQAEQQLTAARAELDAVRTEARRAGVPPGWVR
ncbi:MAG: hypothetical protein ACRD3V_15605 [Vicinamibacteria bacterium]